MRNACLIKFSLSSLSAGKPNPVVMSPKLKNRIIYEFIWLVGIILTSAVVEYVIIEFFDLHPILSVKIQGFIGLVIISYGIRMIARMGKQGIIKLVEEDENTSITDSDKTNY